MNLHPGCSDLTVEVSRLKQTLYGLKEPLHKFHKLQSTKLIGYGFEQCLADTCVLRGMNARPYWERSQNDCPLSH